MAKEDIVLVVAHAMHHLVGKGGTTTQLIKDICGIVVGVGNRGDGRHTFCCLDQNDMSMLAKRLWKQWQRGLGPFITISKNVDFPLVRASSWGQSGNCRPGLVYWGGSVCWPASSAFFVSFFTDFIGFQVTLDWSLRSGQIRSA